MNLRRALYENRLNVEIFLARRGLLTPFRLPDASTAFIISTGRTGTHAIASHLNRLQSVLAVHEPQPNLYKTGLDYASGRISQEAARETIEAARRIAALHITIRRASIYIESNNRLFSLIPILRESFPGSKFIHLVRDGRDVVRSGMDRGWYQKNDIFPDRLTACDIANDPWRDEWENFTPFEKSSWLWQTVDDFIYKDTVGQADSHCVRFEEVFDRQRNYPGLYSIAAFLELQTLLTFPLDEPIAQTNTNRGTHFPRWNTWDEETIEKFNRIAGKSLIRYGYLDRESN
ncbi:hypothetical protein KC887_03170 [Candidatus Kaiserbacteria bacterium]|nr:hypothetical protein [Candidatus Kaiserbacteria bacterium]